MKQVPGETPSIYLGDGVYASFDGFQIWLRTERCLGATPGLTIIHEIALEPAVFSALISYNDALRDHDAQGNTTTEGPTAGAD